jgi:hypothetical protein
MTETKKPTAENPKESRVRHASAQASYMDRMRAQGKEWLATWVPAEARDTFRELAKRAVEDDMEPLKEDIESLEEAIGERVPEWATKNQTLLNIWAISQDEKVIEDAPSDKTDDKKKKKKKKKK